MLHTREDAQGSPGEATADRQRRWHHLRPEPRRRTDFMGFNSTWWMAVGWLLIIVLALSPYPWW